MSYSLKISEFVTVGRHFAGEGSSGILAKIHNFPRLQTKPEMRPICRWRGYITHNYIVLALLYIKYSSKKYIYIYIIIIIIGQNAFLRNFPPHPPAIWPHSCKLLQLFKNRILAILPEALPPATCRQFGQNLV